MRFTRQNIIGLDFLSPKNHLHSIIEIDGKICIKKDTEIMYYEEQGLLNLLLDRLNEGSWRVEVLNYEIY